MNKSNILVTLLAVFFVSACSTTNKDINLIIECKFSNGDDAPVWICNEGVAINVSALKGVVWATGESVKLKAGRSLQKKAAVLDGRRKLLESISTRVESLIKQKAQGSSEETSIESFVQSFAEGLLAGSRPYSSVIDIGDGHMYVIVGIEDKKFKENISENRKYQALRDKILASDGKEVAERIDSGLSHISEAKRNIASN